MSSPILGQMTGGSSEELHVDLRPIDDSEAEDALRKAAETVYQLATQQISQEVEVSQELLVYPEGGVDPVTITETDVEGLQPGRFLRDNIVDFYIRFLERGLSPEHGNRFFFFNSFFFTKLLQSTASTGIDPCKVDYEQVRKWTKEVDLFAKDYIFIPIIQSSHWSLVIICHLSNLTRPPGEVTRSPCVVHLDPIAGQHESFEGLIRSYVLQAWMERFQVSSNGYQLLALCQMKYVETKVPEQDNFHDCGLHVLSYIEAFLMKSTSPDFSFPSSEMDSHFNGPHFVREVLGKRKLIQDLIHELTGKSQERARKRRTIQWVWQFTENLCLQLFHEGNSEGGIIDVQTIGPSFSNGQGIEINHASTTQPDALDAQAVHSTSMSGGNNEPLDGFQIGRMEDEDSSESFSPKQQLTELELQIGGPTHFNGSISVATHADDFDVRHQQSSGIMSRLDGPELQHAEYERVNGDNMLQHPVSEEAPCNDLSSVEKGKNKRGRNMTEEETQELLSCMLEGGRFYKGNGACANWNLICEEINKKLGSLVLADQCRLRYDTLLKAYKTYKKYCSKTSKTFSEITQEERLELKLATTLSEKMYTIIDEIVRIRANAKTSRKRMKLSSSVCNDLHPLGSLDLLAPNPLPIAGGSSFEDEVVVLDSACGTVEATLRNVLPTSVFSSLNEDLQLTLLNLVQECSFEASDVKNGKEFFLNQACRRLAILQDCEPREILKHISQLWKLNLVNVEGMVFEEGHDLAHTDFWEDKTWFLKSEFYEKIWEEVLCKNPQFQTYCSTYLIESSLSQYIRVLNLIECGELEHLDLRGFPNLRSLVIWDCPKLNLVTGWEVPTGLASLKIYLCSADLDFPEIQYLLSLREIEVTGRKSNKSAIPWQLSQFSQCSKLRRLEIWNDESLSEVADLENLKELKFLESLSLGRCSFSSIRGLSGLQALTTLKLVNCPNLRRVPGLGSLKALTHLDISHSGVEDVVGVEELHLLTSLDLRWCASLECLPFLGHLKALVYLDLWGTSIKNVRDREDLKHVKTLKLEWELC